MRIAVLAALLALAAPMAPAAVLAQAATSETRPAAFGIAELMQATALDTIFDQFGAAIAASAREGDISGDEIFLSHWEAAAASAFSAPALHKRLAQALDGKFSDAERDHLGHFFRSDFGRRVSQLERRVSELGAAGQQAATDAGKRLEAEASVVRADQLDELMQLVSAEIASLMAGESMRALLVGMAVAHQRSDIEVPWQDIDAQVEALMPTVIADHTGAQRAMMAYAYRELSDDEMARYIDFLRSAAAQNFYATAVYEVGRIVTRSMSNFGDTLADRLSRVDI